MELLASYSAFEKIKPFKCYVQFTCLANVLLFLNVMIKGVVDFEAAFR